MKNVLIVEDETIFALDLKRILSKSGFNVLRVFTEGTRAVEFALEKKPDVILMDISLKGELMELIPQKRFINITNHS